MDDNISPCNILANFAPSLRRLATTLPPGKTLYSTQDSTLVAQFIHTHSLNGIDPKARRVLLFHPDDPSHDTLIVHIPNTSIETFGAISLRHEVVFQIMLQTGDRYSLCYCENSYSALFNATMETESSLKASHCDTVWTYHDISCVSSDGDLNVLLPVERLPTATGINLYYTPYYARQNCQHKLLVTSFDSNNQEYFCSECDAAQPAHLANVVAVNTIAPLSGTAVCHYCSCCLYNDRTIVMDLGTFA